MTVLSCLDGALPTSEWNDENRIGAFRTDADGDPVLVTIMEDFVFTCSGTIRQWRLQWSHRNTRPGCTVHFHFYVLRINTDPIQQFGPNTLSVQINISNVHVESILDVPSNRRIQVQANDFINIIVELNQGCGSSQFYILSKQYIKNTVYYKHFTSLSDGQQQAQLRYSTPQKPRYRSSRSYSKRYTNTKFEEERYIVPYVTAIMGKVFIQL